MSKIIDTDTPGSEEHDDDAVVREEDHKLWPHARSGLLHLVDLLEGDGYEFEPTPKLMAACGLTSISKWKKVHELMRNWLADRGYDLVNRLARSDGGYAIAQHPQQTLRELLKSTFRALGHLYSANIRNHKLEGWLDELSGDSSLQLMRFRTAMGFLLNTSEQMKREMKKIEGALPELAGVADEVTDIPNKLIARADDSRAKFIHPQEPVSAFDMQIAVLRAAILATRVR